MVFLLTLIILFLYCTKVKDIDELFLLEVLVFDAVYEQYLIVYVICVRS